MKSLGKGWDEHAFYHSHPSNQTFSPGDEEFAKGMGKKMGSGKGHLWVTYGPRGKPRKWTTEKTK